MDADEAKVEAAAKAFLLGLFTGQSAIEVRELPTPAEGGRSWVIRLVAPGNPPGG